MSLATHLDKSFKKEEEEEERWSLDSKLILRYEEDGKKMDEKKEVERKEKKDYPSMCRDLHVIVRDHDELKDNSPDVDLIVHQRP